MYNSNKNYQIEIKSRRDHVNDDNNDIDPTNIFLMVIEKLNIQWLQLQKIFMTFKEQEILLLRIRLLIQEHK